MELHLSGEIAGVDCQAVIDLLAHDEQGRLLLVDHKFSTGYLRRWPQHDDIEEGVPRTDNSAGRNPALWRAMVGHQWRFYALLARSCGYDVDECMINQIYVGERAASASFGGQRVWQVELDYSEAQYLETEHWVRELSYRMNTSRHPEESYWLQNAGKHCMHCDFAGVCATPPELRGTRLARFTRQKRRRP